MIPGACQPDRTRMSGGHVMDHRLSINPVHGVHGGLRLISITSAYGLDFTCKLRLTPFGIIFPLSLISPRLMTPSRMIIEFSVVQGISDHVSVNWSPSSVSQMQGNESIIKNRATIFKKKIEFHYEFDFFFFFFF